MTENISGFTSLELQGQYAPLENPHYRALRIGTGTLAAAIEFINFPVSFTLGQAASNLRDGYHEICEISQGCRTLNQLSERVFRKGAEVLNWALLEGLATSRHHFEALMHSRSGWSVAQTEQFTNDLLTISAAIIPIPKGRRYKTILPDKLSNRQFPKEMLGLDGRVVDWSKGHYFHVTDAKGLQGIFQIGKVEVRQEKFNKGAFVSPLPEFIFGSYGIAFNRIIEKGQSILSSSVHFDNGIPAYWAGFGKAIPVTRSTVEYVVVSRHLWNKARRMGILPKDIPVVSRHELSARVLARASKEGITIPKDWPITRWDRFTHQGEKALTRGSLVASVSREHQERETILGGLFASSAYAEDVSVWRPCQSQSNSSRVEEVLDGDEYNIGKQGFNSAAVTPYLVNRRPFENRVNDLFVSVDMARDINPHFLPSAINHRFDVVYSGMNFLREPSLDTIPALIQSINAFTRVKEVNIAVSAIKTGLAVKAAFNVMSSQMSSQVLAGAVGTAMPILGAVFSVISFLSTIFNDDDDELQEMLEAQAQRLGEGIQESYQTLYGRIYEYNRAISSQAEHVRELQADVLHSTALTVAKTSGLQAHQQASTLQLNAVGVLSQRLHEAHLCELETSLTHLHSLDALFRSTLDTALKNQAMVLSLQENDLRDAFEIIEYRKDRWEKEKILSLKDLNCVKRAFNNWIELPTREWEEGIQAQLLYLRVGMNWLNLLVQFQESKCTIQSFEQLHRTLLEQFSKAPVEQLQEMTQAVKARFQDTLVLFN